MSQHPDSIELRSTRPALSWWLVVGELFLIGLLSIGLGFLIFSLLPMSVGLIIIMVSTFTFPIVRQRLSARDHCLFVVGAWIVLMIVFVLLIYKFGRQHFEWLLDWH